MLGSIAPDDVAVISASFDGSFLEFLIVVLVPYGLEKDMVLVIVVVSVLLLGGWSRYVNGHWVSKCINDLLELVGDNDGAD